MLKDSDSLIYNLIQKEKQRQMQGFELIPSENLIPQDVLEASGSILSNKYSEGYPGKRYYGGNEVIDEIENLAISRAKKLFKAEHVNVQSLSGAPANLSAYFSLLEKGDKLMGLYLYDGGHLTHGYKINFSGKLFTPIPYYLNKETETLDYDAIEKLAKQENPKMIVSGYSAYPRSIDFKRFKEIADSCGAYSMADISHISAFCATDLHENPCPYFDIVTTTTHKTLRGPRGAIILSKEEHAQKIDKAVFPFLQGGPHQAQIGAKAVAFNLALQPSFKNYAQQILKNTKAMEQVFLDSGIRLVSGGTDNHLILADMTSINLTGKESERLLEQAGLYVNANTIPFDSRKPFDPSGIRFGSPSITTRGLKESESSYIAQLMVDVLLKKKQPEKVKQEVQELANSFIYYK